MMRPKQSSLALVLALVAGGLVAEAAHAQWAQYREDSADWVSPRLYRPWGTLDGVPRWRFDGWWHHYTGGWGYSPGLHGEWFLRTGPPYKEYSFSTIRAANMGDAMLEEVLDQPVEELPPSVDPNAEPMGQRRIAPDNLILAVRVPQDARVYVNDQLTENTGGLRYFNSAGLEPGEAYVYRVRAEVERDGEMISETKVARIGAGKSAGLVFTFGEATRERVATRSGNR